MFLKNLVLLLICSSHLCFALFAHKHDRHNDAENLVVKTSNGKVRGTSYYLDEDLNLVNEQSPLAHSRVNAWLGIPYAEKPLGELRFKRAKKARNWRPDVLNVTQLPNTCFQQRDTLIPNFEGIEMWNPNTRVSEDCLYLNIWTPASINRKQHKKIAVVVWIHGGGFVTGSSTLDIYDPRIFVAETQLIFVSIQYRVSLFGFLYLGDKDDAPGNQGLFDQRLALKWIHENIESFGGDSSRITLVGESAGGVSVSFHLLSAPSWPLFNNAIMQSGSPLCPWAIINDKELALERYTNIVNYIGCNQTTSKGKLECLRQIDAQTALSKADEYFNSQANKGILQFAFLPVVDGDFFRDTPQRLLDKKHFKKCPLLMGVNLNEANFFYAYAFEEYRNFTQQPTLDNATYTDHLANIFHFLPQYPLRSSNETQSRILSTYAPSYATNNFDRLDEAGSDFQFKCPQNRLAHYYESSGVFFYHFTELSDKFYWPEWLGVLHTNEIPFTFGKPLNQSKMYDETSQVLSRKMLKYWSNFVRSSTPNDKSKRPKDVAKATRTLKQSIEFWPRFTKKNNFPYIVLNSNVTQHVGYNLRAEYCSFWKNLS